MTRIQLWMHIRMHRDMAAECLSTVHGRASNHCEFQADGGRRKVDEQNLLMCNDGDVIVVVRWLECTVYVSNK